MVTTMGTTTRRTSPIVNAQSYIFCSVTTTLAF